MQRFFRSALLLSMALTLVAPVASQTTREHVLGGRGIAGTGTTRKAVSVEGSAGAREVVQRIISLIGLPDTAFDVRESMDVANAEATTENQGKDRIILYNPTWMSSFRSSIRTNWSDWVVLAHEVGHHVAFHMDPSFPNHEAELQADYFAGFILKRLGAPLPEVQLAMAMIGSDQPSASHPEKTRRVAAITKGWEAADRGGGANVIPAALTVPGRFDMSVPKAIAPSGPRVALLIGNTNYAVAEKLKNPKNDVIAVQRELRKVGFSTTTLYDATATQIADYLRLFREDARDADWALFYFAGRGVEIDGVNYMMPIDVDLETDREAVRRYPQLRLDTAFAAIERAKTVRLVVADSCRIDPSYPPDASNLPPASRVFSVLEPPRGIVVAYSTRAGTYALDGTEDLSPYAKAFIEALRTPGMELDKVFRRVNAEVVSATRGMQEPILHGNWPAGDLHLTAN